MKNLPSSWDVKTGKNIKWRADLGLQSYGNPVVANGKVFVGTNNEKPRNPGIEGDKGVLMCLRESDGKFLWQAVTDKLPSGDVNDWPLVGVCSSPLVEGDRLYYVSNRGELVRLDTEGFTDGENDGPFRDESYKGPLDGDVVWRLDKMKELGVFQHNMANSSPAPWGDLLFLVTSNGRDESHDLSGSGKSSLAFDTLFAEGQRRYIETFSPYARQFFDRMDKPQADSSEGIPPAIAIEQRNAVKTTRSDVGTMTEICDHQSKCCGPQ